MMEACFARLLLTCFNGRPLFLADEPSVVVSIFVVLALFKVIEFVFAALVALGYVSIEFFWPALLFYCT